MFYTVFGDDTRRFGTISEARAYIRNLLSKYRKNSYRILLNKNVKVNPKGYIGKIIGEVSKVTDPDGLVVYLYRDVRDEGQGYYSKGPLYVLKADGTLSSMVSSKFWTEPSRRL